MSRLLESIQIIDEAVINKMKSFATINSTPVQVTYLNPEEEYTIETYPEIIIYRVGSFEETMRLTLSKLRDDFVYNGDNLVQLSERDYPIPMNFLYVIRLYYEYQEDGAQMNLDMLKNLPPRPYPCYITINNVDYDFVFDGHRLFRSSKDDFGLIKFKETDNNRVFCDQYFYYFCSDLDLFAKETNTTVQEIIITTTP